MTGTLTFAAIIGATRHPSREVTGPYAATTLPRAGPAFHQALPGLVEVQPGGLRREFHHLASRGPERALVRLMALPVVVIPAAILRAASQV